MAFNGSFLWKTLFPAHFDKNKVRRAIQTVLNNPTRVENRGWAKILSGHQMQENGIPMLISVIVNTNDESVVTAYPSFTQVTSPGTTKGLVGFRRQLVFVANTQEEYEALQEHSPKITQFFNEFQSVKANLETSSWWKNLSLNRKIDTIGEFVFSRFDFSGLSIGGMDLIYHHFKRDVGYQAGEVYGIAAKIIELFLNDRSISISLKYDFLKQLIDSLLVNDDRMGLDILWSKYIVNLVFRKETLFEKPMFDSLITKLHDSPVLWTLLIQTKSPGRNRSEITVQDIIANMTDFEEPRVDLSDVIVPQTTGFRHFFNHYRSSWRSEFSIIQRLSTISGYEPEGEKSDVILKLLIDYLNSYSYRLFQTQHRRNGLLSALLSELDFSHIRRVLSKIKDYDTSVDIDFMAAYINFMIAPNQRSLRVLYRNSEEARHRRFYQMILENRDRYLENGRGLPVIVYHGRGRFEFQMAVFGLPYDR
jgi:hypothetical protein